MPRRNSRSTPSASLLDLARLPHFMDLNGIPISVRLGNFRAEVVYFGLLGTRWWRNYLHTHSFHEVCYVYEGEGTFTLDGVTHALVPGQLFFARPNQSHEIVSSRKKPLGICFWAYTLMPLSDRRLSPAARSVDALLNTYARAGVATREDALSVARTVDLLTDEVARKQPGYATAVDALIAKLLLDTARLGCPAAAPLEAEYVEPPARSHAESVIHTATHYLRDNFSRPIGVRDLAAQVSLSERHVSRLFRQTLGVSVLDYLTSLRLDTASQLLLNRDMPIKSISATCGYPDVRYFTTLFRKRFGVTPAAFRDARGTIPVASKGPTVNKLHVP